MKLPTNSIRWRLQIWYASLLLIALAGLSLAVLRLSRIHQVRQIDQQITEQQHAFFDILFKQDLNHKDIDDQNAKRPPPDFDQIIATILAAKQNPTSSLSKLFSGTAPGFYYFALSNNDDSMLITSENIPPNFTFPNKKEGKEFDAATFRGNYREHMRRAPAGIRICFGKDASQAIKEMDQFAISIISFASGFWLIGLAGGWWMLGRAIRPIKDISTTAVEIAAGNLNKRIELAGNQSELNELAQVLNHTFDELEASMERQRQFTGNASHELRTPLTVILSETQRMLKRERQAEEYQVSMEVCQKAGLRMKSLVEGLLLLARQDNRSQGESKITCDLKDIVEQSTEALTPLATAHNMRIICSLESATMTADPASLRILVDNLIENAISHHPGDGIVTIILQQTPEGIELSVKDDGPGIAPEYHQKIFERFYQLDRSRSQASGHSGLGLALVSKIAENHAGQCSIDSSLGKGCRFRILFNTSS